MITYELAKELKENGFPFKQTRSFNVKYFNIKGLSVSFSCSDITENNPFPKDFDMYIPTLSELIEACGDGFAGMLYQPAMGESSGLTKAFSNFYMIAPEPTRDFHKFLTGIIINGSTPEEAVARLWLALNKK